MNVLLIAPTFYGYHKVIQQEIERQCMACDEYLYPSGFFYSLIYIMPFFKRYYNKIRNWHLTNFLKHNKKHYDLIIVIKGSEVSCSNYLLLKQKYKNAKFVLYIWDDIALDKEELDIVKYFHRTFSYNPEDCKRYNMNFRPMFFDQSRKLKSNVAKNIDLFYIGSYRPNRFKFVKRIIECAKEQIIKKKIILRCSIPYFLSRKENITYIDYFKFKSVPYNDMVEMLQQSKCCLELCRPGQESLSTRAFEALYTRTKVITTNSSIKNYDFYNENNILVVDEMSPNIPKGWIAQPYLELEDIILHKYSLQSFCKDLIYGDNC